MKISQFIEKALFDKDSGYYKTINPIGKDSDFITAPEISQVFGEILAAYILEISQNYENIAFVEMGAGKGTLFVDIVAMIEKLALKNNIAASFLQKTTFHIIEINPVLQKIQQKRLQNYRVNWYQNFDEFLAVNSKEKIFFISNELFDCFPIDQYILTEIGWRERLIDLKNKVFTLAPFDKEVNDFVNLKLKESKLLAPIGAVFEYSNSARNFMTKLCQSLKIQGGMAINIDYGYFKTEFANTLQAIKNHKKCDIFSEIGKCDITSHVDFLALDNISKKHFLNSSLITQGEFLESLGINQRREKLLANNKEKAQEINLAIDRLIDSYQMGALFKVHLIWL